MKKIKNQSEYPIKSYLIDGEFINELGETVKIDGVTTRLKCRLVIERKNNKYGPNHKMCQGRGYLNFDSGVYVYNAEGNRRATATWVRSCSCVNKKLEQNPDLLKDFIN